MMRWPKSFKRLDTEIKRNMRESTYRIARYSYNQGYLAGWLACQDQQDPVIRTAIKYGGAENIPEHETHKWLEEQNRKLSSETHAFAKRLVDKLHQHQTRDG